VAFVEADGVGRRPEAFGEGPDLQRLQPNPLSRATVKNDLDIELGSTCTVAPRTVSDIAREVGIAPSAVRFYERRGVLPAATRRGNGYREYTDDDLCRLRLIVSLRSLGLDLAVAGRLANQCLAGQCDAMSRDLAPLVSAQRAAVARSQAELAELDCHLAALEVSLAAGEPDPNLCLEKGGESDDELRLRAELPVSAYPRLPVLTRG